MVIYTCPKCGGDLLETQICTFPPIPMKECQKCGWRFKGKPKEVTRVSFRENSANELTEGCETI